MPAVYGLSMPWSMHDRFASASGRNHAKPVFPHESLVISRNLTSAGDGAQIYIPARFLRGLLPSSLLDDFIFCQIADESLIGYPRKTKGKKRGVTASYIVKVELVKDPGVEAVAQVTRAPLSQASVDSMDASLAFFCHLRLGGTHQSCWWCWW